MQTTPTIATAILVLAVLAGCLEGSEPGPTTSPTPTPTGLPADFADPFLMAHDHSNAALHKLAWGMKLHSHHALGGSSVKSSGAHAVDVQNGYLFVATYGAAADVDGGVWIFDLKDPRKPVLVGTLRLPGNLGGDRSMEATDDGNWIVLGTEATDCAGHTNPFAPGLYLIDARDKTRPVIADYIPDSGIHSVIVHKIKGEDYAFVLGLDNQNIVKINRAGPKPVMERVGSILIGHDGAAYDDPLLGVPLFYSATAQKNLFISDVSDPSKPVRIGTWSLSDDESKDHYVHAVSVDWIEGQRIITLESEDWKSKPSPVWILNATDLKQIDRIANWTNPGKKPANAGDTSAPPNGDQRFAGELTFSTHNPRMENGRVYLAHYHGGVWILNVSSLAKARAPEILGYYLPHDNNGGFQARSAEGAYPKPPALCDFKLNEIPIVFDLEVQDGIVYAADLHTGLYVVELDKGTTSSVPQMTKFP